jgi:hypothetical protein
MASGVQEDKNWKAKLRLMGVEQESIAATPPRGDKSGCSSDDLAGNICIFI